MQEYTRHHSRAEGRGDASTELPGTSVSGFVAAEWEGRYQSGYGAFYPWDVVVSFVKRYAPKKPTADVSILEIGCGTGANLLFCAREGYRVQGLDGSPTALATTAQRLIAAGLRAPLHQGLIGDRLPFAEATFDLVIDHASMTCNPLPVMHAALSEVQRVLKPGGALFSLVYSGPCTGACEAAHYGPGDIKWLYSLPWDLEVLVSNPHFDLLTGGLERCAEMTIIARKSHARQD